MSGITQERLQTLLSYNLESGQFYWNVDRSHNARAGFQAGTIRPDGYVQIIVDGRSYLAHRLAFLFVTGRWPNEDVDHIDRQKSNNAWDNLRSATKSQNTANYRFSGGTSKYKGVSFDKRKRKWRVTFCNKYVRRFSSEEDAARAYDALAKAKYGEFAYLNFPQNGGPL